MREDGCANLVVPDSGSFRARLTRIATHRLRLLSAEESAARIAFFSVQSDSIFVSVPFGHDLPQVWAGTSARAEEIVTLGAGHRSYNRTAARCRWGAILLPTALLLSYARAITGTPLVLPSGMCRWRPSAKAWRNLIRLHISATRVANTRAGVITTFEPTNTLELDLIEAIVACLPEGSAQTVNKATRRHTDVMARFDDLLRTHPNKAMDSAAVCVALDISGRTLRKCCGEHLGMGPIPYMRLRRMQLARRALRGTHPDTASVAEIAAQYGFGEAGRFAGAYRARFGELPSVTLRRSAAR
jgi:AraC-like DNA-binding protein